MSETSTTAMLVGTPDMFAARSNAITATVRRDEIKEAVASEPPADLILEILRRAPGEDEAERRTVNVAWTQKDLESLLDLPDADAITFYFDPDELEQVLEDADVEGHGLREAAVVLSIAAAAAVGAGNAYAQSDSAEASQAQAAVVSHDEASLVERGIGVQTTAASHDEASLSARGIDPGIVAAVHDEATSTSRGIEPGTVAASHDESGLTTRGIDPGIVAAVHDEATSTSRGIEPGTIPASHDESGLTARGIDPGIVAAVHDEGTLVDRGIEPLPAVHDEASLTTRGIEAQPTPAVHDEATLVTRGIESETPVVSGDTGGFELPSVDPGTAAAVAGGLAGAGLLIAAAAFATRRREFGHP